MALGIFLVGCQDSSMSDLRVFVDDAFKDEKPEIPPLPVVEPFIPYTYAAFDLNDPFNFGNINLKKISHGLLLKQHKVMFY